jgi:ribosomal protein S27AE
MQANQANQAHTYGGNLAERSFDEGDMQHALRLDTQTAERTRPCPKCGTRAALHASDCGRCGTNFARHRLMLEMAAQARPVYTARTVEEQRTGKTLIREVNAPPKTTSSLPLILACVGVLAALAYALWG